MKTLLTYFFTGLIYLLMSSCNIAPPKMTDNTYPVGSPNSIDLQDYKTAYFASGCFWCVEAIYESVYGVTEVISGYAGGSTVHPTYQQIGTGRTGHAETVEVYYDPSKVDFETLVTVFFDSHDPTTKNRQGPDSGTQYRSIAFYSNETEKKIIEDYVEKLTKNQVYSSPIVTEIKPHTVFYKAEEYHQDFEKLNPSHPYVRQISIPRLNNFKQKSPSLLKENK
jgi:peptide-methionine (S)-S-oxide reductase